ncbi:MAG: hydrogenase [Campylobacterales bacterium]
MRSLTTSGAPSKPKKQKAIWLQGITCHGNTHAFLSHERSEREAFLALYELIHPHLDPPISYVRQQEPFDLLIIEGALPTATGVYWAGGEDLLYLAQRLIRLARAIILAGSCAVFGGVHRLGREEATGLLSAGEEDKGWLESQGVSSLAKIIALPGCPVHPAWIIQSGVALALGVELLCDEKHRPLAYYGMTVHEGCTRCEAFEWKIEADRFGSAQGCLFYHQGCRGP